LGSLSGEKKLLQVEKHHFLQSKNYYSSPTHLQERKKQENGAYTDCRSWHPAGKWFTAKKFTLEFQSWWCITQRNIKKTM